MSPEAVLPFGHDRRSNAYALPARVGPPFDAIGVKWAIHQHHDEDVGPGVVSTTLINDLSSGRPRAVVESALLTVVRTAAVSALALRTLMPSPLQKVAVLGAGAQARGHLEMLYALFPGVRTINVWNRTRKRAEHMLASLARPSHIEVAMAELDSRRR